MILSYKHNYIFLKAYKVGGTSVQIALSDHLGPNDISTRVSEYKPGRDQSTYRVKVQNTKGFRQHMKPWEIRRKIGKAQWDKMFKFTCVRNPWEMSVSIYYYGKFYKKHTFKKWIKMCHCPIYAFIFWKGSGLEACDKYIRFEHLQKDYDRICKIIDIPTARLPRTKNIGNKKKKPLRKVYDAEAVDIIARKYARFIERFGYQYDG